MILGGWFYKPLDTAQDSKLPCLIMSHGLTALKEMDLDMSASCFTHRTPLTCLVYDNRGLGSSDAKDGEPRFGFILSKQASDYSDAIAYASTRPDVSPSRIGTWSSSYSGGHVLWVGAVDQRVKAVLAHVPLVCRASTSYARKTGWIEQRKRTIPVVDKNPLALSALPTADSYQFGLREEE